MKKLQLTFIALLLSISFYAQGIAVQGIARDDENAAITNKQLTFTFEIVKSDNSVVFSETETIQTDGFGVFSHIVSTGTADTSGDKVTFSNIDFSEQNMHLKVYVDLPPVTEVYDQPFQYTPYAHYAKAAETAKDGVPTGAIMPYIGSTAPEGWVICDGRTLTNISGSSSLIAIVGNNAPDLQGMFLRGTGTSSLGADYVGPNLMSTQGDDIMEHEHSSGDYKTDVQGEHNHNDGSFGRVLRLYVSGSTSPDGFNASDSGGELDILNSRFMEDSGAHEHDVQGWGGNARTSKGSAIKETRPVNYGVNYIIKL